MNPHFTGLNLIFSDKCCMIWVRNTWLTCLAFAFRNPWVLCGLFCARSFINETCLPCLAKIRAFMCPSIHPSVLLLVSVQACKGRKTQQGEWFDCLSVWNKNIYIEKHGTNIQSDSCKLSLRSKRERHMQQIETKITKLITNNKYSHNDWKWLVSWISFNFIFLGQMVEDHYSTPFWWNLTKFGMSHLFVNAY